jgi:DNA-binding IclR family transcriptional regulator
MTSQSASQYNSQKRENPLFVASLERALQVLEAFTHGQYHLRLSEITERTGLNRSAVQRFLHTWESLGYLKKHPTTRRFSLTPKVMDLGYNFLKGNRLVEVATPYLLDIRERTGNSVYLGTLFESDIIYLVRLPKTFMLFESTLPGRRIPAFCGGRAILSRMPKNEAAGVLTDSERTPITPHTVTDLQENLDLLQAARNQGFTVTVQEFLIGEIAVSAPVTNREGRPLAAVYISADYARWPRERVEKELAPIAMEAAAAIGAHL